MEVICEKLREEAKQRELAYKKQLKKEAFAKFKHVIITIMPALVAAIFDSTVRSIHVDIVKPQDHIISSTTSNTFNYINKAIYFEELLTWN